MSSEASKCRCPDVTNVQIHIVDHGHDGLIAWVTCILGDAIALNNIAVRRGRDGGLMLTYPAKQTTTGTRFYYFNPISREASAALETAIIGKVRELIGPGVVPVVGGGD